MVAGTQEYDGEAWFGFSLYLQDNVWSGELGPVIMQLHYRYGGLSDKPPYCFDFKLGGPSLINVSSGQDGKLRAGSLA